MVVHGESLKRLVPFYKSRSLRVLTTGFKLRGFLPKKLLFAKSMLNWIDQYTILWKSTEQLRSYSRGYFSHETSPNAPSKRILTKIWNFCVFPLAERNRSVYCWWKSVQWLKSYFWGSFSQKYPLLPPYSVEFETFWLFDFILLVNLNRSVSWV
jgi:hypothetical protein